MNTHLLVTGGAGFVGRSILQQARPGSASGTLHQTPSLGLPGVTYHVCDLQNLQEVLTLLDRVRPTHLIHTACSDQVPDFNIIVQVAAQLALHTHHRNIRFIHLSTDHVFDGLTPPYSEKNPIQPITPYGMAKGEAENLISSLNPQATIIRTSLLYDLRSLCRQGQRLFEAISQKTPFALFIDEIRSPLWVENFANAVLEIANRDLPGVIHVGGPQALNRWELGMGLLHHFDINPADYIRQGRLSDTDLLRPPNLTLDSAKATEMISTPLLSLQEATAFAQKPK